MTENKQADFHIIAMLDQKTSKIYPGHKHEKRETCAVMKLKRGTCTTDTGFARLLLSFLLQSFTLNTITEFIFFSHNLTSQYYINYSSSFVLMYF